MLFIMLCDVLVLNVMLNGISISLVWLLIRKQHENVTYIIEDYYLHIKFCVFTRFKNFSGWVLKKLKRCETISSSEMSLRKKGKPNAEIRTITLNT